MRTYIISRLIHSIVILILITIAVFFAMRILPGDPISMIFTSGELASVSNEEIEALRHEFGLDKPLIQQYFDWISGVIRGDLGLSIIQREPVIEEILVRLPITLHLAILALFSGLIIGLPAGVICAVKRGGWVDNVITMLANAGITIPVFWLGIMLIYLFSIQLGWLPTHGYTSPFTDFWTSTKQLIMPVFCLTVFSLASNTRQARSSMLEVIQQDYIRTAWSKGLGERHIIIRHALKNGLIPVITLAGVGFSHTIGGSVLVETVFNIPGMGRMVVSAVLGCDYPLIQGSVLFIAIMVLCLNFIIDISYGWLDPRIRFE